MPNLYLEGFLCVLSAFRLQQNPADLLLVQDAPPFEDAAVVAAHRDEEARERMGDRERAERPPKADEEEEPQPVAAAAEPASGSG